MIILVITKNKCMPMHDDTNNHYTQLVDQLFYSVQRTTPALLASARLGWNTPRIVLSVLVSSCWFVILLSPSDYGCWIFYNWHCESIHLGGLNLAKKLALEKSSHQISVLKAEVQPTSCVYLHQMVALFPGTWSCQFDPQEV